MGRVVGAITALAVFVSQGALAADLRLAPRPAPPPQADWTGLYVGVGIGAKWGDASWTTTAVSDVPTDVGILDATAGRAFSPSAFRTSAYLGYNWQLANWVYGLEGDLGYSNKTTTTAGIPGCTIGCFAGAPGPGVDTASVGLKWDASARARLGYLVSPNLLLYGTGGIEWQRMNASAACANTSVDPICLNSPPFAFKTQTNATTLNGWTLGAGAEWKLAPDWLLRGEYRFSDLGRSTGTFFSGQPVVEPGGDAIHYTIGVRAHLLTFGLAYRFI